MYRSKQLKIATAESCTGGLIAAELTQVPGSSDVFERGFVTYSNAAKIDQLGVLEADLQTFGAVSEVVAKAMAIGALDKSLADISVSVTGIAGPGGSEHKPEGLVHFARATRSGTLRHIERNFGSLGRTEVREKSVEQALTLLFEAI